MTTLEGWTNPLPEWLIVYINAGTVTVNQGDGFQYLLGTVTNPEGTVIVFE